MKITGIVTEYNPFHNGHLHHIEEARRLSGCDLLIAIMSGPFVQRGEPAIVDKWKRTQAALDHGVDIVIELPYIACTQSASRFASAAVKLLHLAGCDTLVFGSETNDLETLKTIAELPIRVDNLKEAMKTGISYPKASGQLQGAFDPNDILAIAYLKALQDYPMTPVSIQRTNAYHGLETDSPIASATALRKALFAGESVENMTPMAEVLAQSELNRWEPFYPLLRHLLLTLAPQELEKIFLMDEGLEHHLAAQAALADTFEDFMQKAISRRYTRSRIQRTLTHLLTHTTKEEVKNLPPMHTLRLLGFNDKGRSYLKRLKDQPVKVASRFNQLNAAYRAMEYRATLAYAASLSALERKRLLQREIEGPIVKKG